MFEKFNYFLGITVVSWLLVIMVMASDLYAPFKAVLTAYFSHHWIAKLVISIIVFLLVGFLVSKKQVSEKTAFYSAIASIAIMFGFFVFEFLTK